MTSIYLKRLFTNDLSDSQKFSMSGVEKLKADFANIITTRKSLMRLNKGHRNGPIQQPK